MKSDGQMVQEIKSGLVARLNSEFNYCGIAEGPNSIMLNSGKGNIVINIKWESDKPPSEEKEESQ